MDFSSHISEVIDDGQGPWFVVYYQAEGFTPWTLLVRTGDETDAATAWEEHDRNAPLTTFDPSYDDHQLVVRRVRIT